MRPVACSATIFDTNRGISFNVGFQNLTPELYIGARASVESDLGDAISQFNRLHSLLILSTKRNIVGVGSFSRGFF